MLLPFANPPYSQDNVEKLIRFCTSPQNRHKPFFLLMPNYFVKKNYYIEKVDNGQSLRPFYVAPRKRYRYRTPKGGRDQGHDCEKTLAVVGHEIGHSILHHNWALLLVTMGNLFVLFFSYGVFQSTPSIVTSFGFSENETGNAFLKIQCFMAVYGMAVMPIWNILMNAFVRQLEFAADRYAVRLGHDISSSLLKISITNKADFNPDWLHSWYHLSHPPPNGTNGGGKSISGNAF